MLKTLVLIPGAAFALTFGGCSMAPKFQTPATPVPSAYSAVGQTTSAAAQTMPSLSNTILDAQLRGLVETALANNQDMRKALLNVAAARAQFKISSAERLPQFAATAGAQRSRLPVKERSNPAVPLENDYTRNIGLSAFEVDLFGRVRSLSDSAFQEYLAQAQSARAARITLIAAVSEAYVRHQAALKKEQLAKEILISREDSLKLVKIRRLEAQASTLDEQEAAGLVEQARIQVIASGKETLISRNALQLLIGEKSLATEIRQVDIRNELFAELAPGLPSDLLVRRPDIMAAEHHLRSANADIGAARAAFFPQISLTALWGGASPELSRLFSPENRKWQFAPQATLPIFSAGKNRAHLSIVKLRKVAAIADYEQAIQVAFTEVNDALIDSKTAKETCDAQHKLTLIAEAVLSNVRLRYETGVDSYPHLLDVQVRHSGAQTEEVETRAALNMARIHLIKALGNDLDNSGRT